MHTHAAKCIQNIRIGDIFNNDPHATGNRNNRLWKD